MFITCLRIFFPKCSLEMTGKPRWKPYSNLISMTIKKEDTLEVYNKSTSQGPIVLQPWLRLD